MRFEEPPIDTSSMIAFLEGADGPDTAIVDAVLHDHTAVLAPVVLAELLSLPGLDRRVAEAVLDLPMLPLRPGYWERVGRLRAKVLAAGLRARLVDALIAQCCADASIPLVTRDADFRHFRKPARLEEPIAQIGPPQGEAQQWHERLAREGGLRLGTQAFGELAIMKLTKRVDVQASLQAVREDPSEVRGR